MSSVVPQLSNMQASSLAQNRPLGNACALDWSSILYPNICDMGLNRNLSFLVTLTNMEVKKKNLYFQCV